MRPISRSWRVGHDDRALEHLARPGQPQQDVAGVVGDLELVGHELVEARHEAQHLLRRALADLVDERDLVAVLVEHRVLLVQLEDLRLLVDDQDRLVEDGPGAAAHRALDAGATPALVLHLLGDLVAVALVADGEEPVDGVHSSTDRALLRLTDGIDRRDALRAHVLRPLRPVPVPMLEPPHRIRVPVSRVRTHARQTRRRRSRMTPALSLRGRYVTESSGAVASVTGNGTTACARERYGGRSRESSGRVPRAGRHGSASSSASTPIRRGAASSGRRSTWPRSASTIASSTSSPGSTPTWSIHLAIWEPFSRANPEAGQGAHRAGGDHVPRRDRRVPGARVDRAAQRHRGLRTGRGCRDPARRVGRPSTRRASSASRSPRSSAPPATSAAASASRSAPCASVACSGRTCRARSVACCACRPCRSACSPIPPFAVVEDVECGAGASWPPPAPAGRAGQRVGQRSDHRAPGDPSRRPHPDPAHRPRLGDRAAWSPGSPVRRSPTTFSRRSTAAGWPTTDGWRSCSASRVGTTTAEVIDKLYAWPSVVHVPAKRQVA